MLAIESVLAQTHPSVEAVVIDDASTDDTEARVRELDSPRVRYIRQENSGVSMARNRGIENARGRYLMFLDDDDLLAPEGVAHSLEVLESQPDVAITYGNVGVIDTEGTLINPKGFLPLAGGDIFARILVKKTTPVIITWCVRREVFDKIGMFYPWTSSEDFDMSVRMAGSYKFHAIDKTIAFHRVHDTVERRSAMDDREKIIRSGVNHVDMIRKYYEQSGRPHDRLYHRAVSLWYSYTGFHLLKIRDVDGARQYMKLGLRHRPWDRRLLMKLLITSAGKPGVEFFFSFRKRVKSLVGPKLSLKLHRLFD